MTKKKIILILRIIMPIVAITCTVLFTPWGIVTAWLAPLPDTIEQQVEKAIDYDLDGIIVYIDQTGAEPALYSAGWFNREEQVPANPAALFKIASISKMFIAAATTKIIVEGKLSPDDTLDELYPDLADRIENAEDITLRMLVQHRSGIPNYTDTPNFPWDNAPDNLGSLALVLDQPAKFKPNARYQYSNSNYALIGLILDRTLGYSHHLYIRNEILEPLGLNHTYSLLNEVDIADVMSGYHIGYEPDIKNNNYTSSGGSMIATAEDTGRFLRALIDGSLFTDEEQALYSSLYEYRHTGLLPGYSSIARYHEDPDAVVIQFVNTSGGDSWGITEVIYSRIVKILRRQTENTEQ